MHTAVVYTNSKTGSNLIQFTLISIRWRNVVRTDVSPNLWVAAKYALLREGPVMLQICLWSLVHVFRSTSNCIPPCQHMSRYCLHRQFSPHSPALETKDSTMTFANSSNSDRPATGLLRKCYSKYSQESQARWKWDIKDIDSTCGKRQPILELMTQHHGLVLTNSNEMKIMESRILFESGQSA